MGASPGQPIPKKNVYGVNNLAVNPGLLAQQADVGDGMVAAGVGAAGPVDGERVGMAQPFLQVIGHLHRQLFSINQGKVAIVYAGATHQPPHYFRRIIPELLKQWFGLESSYFFIRNARNDQVLAGSQPDPTVTINVG